MTFRLRWLRAVPNAVNPPFWLSRLFGSDELLSTRLKKN